MSNPGMQAAVADALQRSGGQAPQGARPGAPAGQQQGQGGGLAELAQAFARCEQTGQVAPQDRAVLQAGLPKLVQMVQIIQKMLQGGGGAPGGGQPTQ